MSPALKTRLSRYLGMVRNIDTNVGKASRLPSRTKG